MENNIPLTTIQRWMQSVIEHPGTNDEAWNSEQAQKELPFDEAYANVLPSKTLTPVERIGIYRKMFFLRMTESMAIDYPGVKNVLGEFEFDRIVAEEYVKKFPSHSYTLNHLGRYFPQFIQETDLRNKAFLYDLSRLELSITNNMDAEESPIVHQQEIASVQPDQWEHAILIPIAALEMLEFDHNVCEYLDAVIEEVTVPEIKNERTFVVVYRKTYRTYWDILSSQQYFLLSALVSRKTFSESIALLVEQFPDSQEELQQKLFEWFNEWVSSGYFSKIKLR
ncbi:MAG: DNA-binding domain-containing protein [Bacteroidota bacterium]|nr:DNA-binding domain-containing protein [Bacteroidota bacterium]